MEVVGIVLFLQSRPYLDNVQIIGNFNRLMHANKFYSSMVHKNKKYKHAAILCEKLRTGRFSNYILQVLLLYCYRLQAYYLRGHSNVSDTFLALLRPHVTFFYF